MDWAENSGVAGEVFFRLLHHFLVGQHINRRHGEDLAPSITALSPFSEPAHLANSGL